MNVTKTLQNILAKYVSSKKKQCVTMATAVRMSNTTSDSLTTELSRTVVPCALKNNSWLVYN